jgi:hypothetical protein
MKPATVTVSVSEPLPQGSKFIGTIDRPENYQHIIQAFGGFHSASFNLTVNWTTLWDWLMTGIGRHLEVFGPATDICFEGFVNVIRAEWGPATITVGPLLDVGNRIQVAYVGVDVSVFPPIYNVHNSTAWAEDTDSQALWGIHPKRYNLTRGNVSDAEWVRDMVLGRGADPPIEIDWSSGRDQPASLTIEVLGYRHMLTYVYNNNEVIGRQDASAKIINVLTGTDPATGNPYNLNNSWLAFDTTYIEDNTYQVIQYEAGYRMAEQVLRDTVVMGDGSARWTFGIYEGRRAYYQAVGTDVSYLQYVTEIPKRVLTVHMHEVKPWRVRPGALVEFPDLYPDSPRVIEEVVFKAPDNLTFATKAMNDMSQLLAAYGVRGMS